MAVAVLLVVQVKKYATIFVFQSAERMKLGTKIAFVPVPQGGKSAMENVFKYAERMK